MTGTTLLFIIMPIIVAICGAVLIVLPFLAARNSSWGIASGVPAGAEDSTVARHCDSRTVLTGTQAPTSTG
jgi:hypothetical protein